MAESKQISISKKESNVELTSPKQLIAFSNDLKDMIVDNGLYTLIQGKAYVNVEGWQMAGALCGLYPIVESSEDVSTDNEIKYRAKVTIRNRKDDRIEGVGFATCSNREKGKGNFQEYAIESMAQTRAIGKAYRTILGYLLKMAGYEATPWEEMEPIKIQEQETTQDKVYVNAEVITPLTIDKVDEPMTVAKLEKEKPKKKTTTKKKTTAKKEEAQPTRATNQVIQMQEEWNNILEIVKGKIKLLMTQGCENQILGDTIKAVLKDDRKIAQASTQELKAIDEQLDLLLGGTNE